MNLRPFPNHAELLKRTQVWRHEKKINVQLQVCQVTIFHDPRKKKNTALSVSPYHTIRMLSEKLALQSPNSLPDSGMPTLESGLRLETLPALRPSGRPLGTTRPLQMFSDHFTDTLATFGSNMKNLFMIRIDLTRMMLSKEYNPPSSPWYAHVNTSQ